MDLSFTNKYIVLTFCKFQLLPRLNPQCDPHCYSPAQIHRNSHNPARLQYHRPNPARSSFLRPKPARSCRRPNPARSMLHRFNPARSFVRRLNPARFMLHRPNPARSSLRRPNPARLFPHRLCPARFHCRCPSKYPMHLCDHLNLGQSNPPLHPPAPYCLQTLNYLLPLSTMPLRHGRR